MSSINLMIEVCEMFFGVVITIIIKFGYNARCHWLKERAL